jgi:type 1 glutamine amidotransferase
MTEHRLPTLSLRAHRYAGALALALLTLIGCSSDEQGPVAPSTAGSAGSAGAMTTGGGGGGGAASGGASAAGAAVAAGNGGSVSNAGTAGTGTAGAGGSGGAAGASGAAGSGGSGGAPQPTSLEVLAIGEIMTGDGPEIHAPFVQAAKTWLSTEPNLKVTHIESPNTLTDELLTQYDLILQLNYSPWRWNKTAQAAFEKYISEGRGGWVGMHHSGLYGPAVTPESEEPWTWFYDFLGKINYKNYIASFAAATVHVEDAAHPLFKDVPATFEVTTEEWYTWDKSPRPNVTVLANVDEDSYEPSSNIKMGGDHPVIWTNPSYAGKNVYIFMGHHPNLFQNTAYVTLLRNAIWWAGTPK